MRLFVCSIFLGLEVGLNGFERRDLLLRKCLKDVCLNKPVLHTAPREACENNPSAAFLWLEIQDKCKLIHCPLPYPRDMQTHET